MKNFIVDAILFALFVAELCFHYLPKILHEIFGVAFVILIFVHFGINFRRFFGLFRNMSPKKFLSMEADLALTLGMAIILLTGLCMSNYLFPDLMYHSLRRNMTIHSLHTSTPYILMILIGMHVGLHWREMSMRFLKLIKVENLSRTWRIFCKTVLVMFLIFGVAGFFLNRVLDRILMKHIFATPATDLPVWIFILMIVGGVAFFALITNLIITKIFKR